MICVGGSPGPWLGTPLVTTSSPLARSSAPAALEVCTPMAAPGWYPDPYRRYAHRWWDGTGWTRHVAGAAPADRAPVDAGAGRDGHDNQDGQDGPGGPGGPGDPGGDGDRPGDRYDPGAVFEREPTPVDGRPRERPAAYWARLVASTDPDELRVQPGPEGRALVRGVRRLRRDGDELQPEPGRLRTVVRQRLAAVRGRLVERQAADTPIEQLREAMAGRVQLGALEAHGYRSVLDVAGANPDELDGLPRVDTHTAHEAVGAARRAMEGMEDDVTVRLDPDQRDPAETRLLAAAWHYDRVRRAVDAWDGEFTEFRSWVDPLVRPAARVSRRLRFLLRREARLRGLAALQELDARMADERTERLAAGIAEARRAVAEAPPAEAELWRDYERRPVEYNLLLADIGRAGTAADEEGRAEAARGYVPAELAEAVRRQELDTSYLTATLRGYQAFGAKFALRQRRAILGDEMGLGKTIEAIATLAHLRAQGATHFLTVCPASVLVNWMQEVAKHSELEAHRIHGADRDAVLERWRAEGGLGVTTYETLRSLDGPFDDVDLSMLVVDEAHFVKNPDTRRSQTVRTWMDSAERVLFLTGTPMENRVDEFRTLVGYLQPEVAASIGASDGLAGAKAFRRTVAPVYLRRNQDDVLTELPERLDQLDWVELTPADLDAYREAVASENFMAMRRATFVGDGRRPSAKLERLAEILEEAAESGRKVVVFSFFRRTLDLVCSMVGVPVFGPLDGSMKAENRQQLVDDFTAVEGHAVLVSQIQAGGVGLNMQAASVVVLTEPQWKPSSEEQAIARCHRMGQVRRVQVHRLLAEDSVDQRMLEVLAKKGALMDAYVRESDLKDAARDAVDASSVGVVRDAPAPADATDADGGSARDADDERRIMASERERLGLAAVN
jgi:hypothetical protein